MIINFLLFGQFQILLLWRRPFYRYGSQLYPSIINCILACHLFIHAGCTSETNTTNGKSFFFGVFHFSGCTKSRYFGVYNNIMLLVTRHLFLLAFSRSKPVTVLSGDITYFDNRYTYHQAIKPFHKFTAFTNSGSLCTNSTNSWQCRIRGIFIVNNSSNRDGNLRCCNP